MEEDGTVSDGISAAYPPSGTIEPDMSSLAIALDAIPQMVWTAQPDGRHDFYNRRWFEFTGLPRRTGMDQTWAEIIHPDDHQRARAAWHQSLTSGEPYEAEYRLRHHSGAWCWTLARALPQHEADGSINRWYGTCTEIEGFKHLQGQLELLAGELSHRIKNVFAVVSSIITLSARDTPDAQPFATALAARVRALARAHDHVRPGADAEANTGADTGHEGVPPPFDRQSLQTLLQALLEPYANGYDVRIMVRGKDHAIGQQAATALALIVHELATNSVKYGAFSTPDGRVRIDYAIEGASLRLIWQEIGAPWQAAAPAGSGFGTSMTDRVSQDQLQAEVTRNWLPEGLELTMRIPLQRLAS